MREQAAKFGCVNFKFGNLELTESSAEGILEDHGIGDGEPHWKAMEIFTQSRLVVATKKIQRSDNLLGWQRDSNTTLYKNE